MDVPSYLCWSRAECSGELSKYELSFCDHLAHPYLFCLCSFIAHPSLVSFCLCSFIVILYVFFLPFLSSSFLFPFLPLSSSPFPSTSYHVLLCFVCSPLPSSPNILRLFLFFPSYSLTFSCTNRLTPPLASLPLPSIMPFSIPLYPLLISPPAPDLASPGPLPSPSAHSCSPSPALFFPSPLSFSLSVSSGLVELDLVLLPPPFACVIFSGISCWFGC